MRSCRAEVPCAGRRGRTARRQVQARVPLLELESVGLSTPHTSFIVDMLAQVQRSVHTTAVAQRVGAVDAVWRESEEGLYGGDLWACV